MEEEKDEVEEEEEGEEDEFDVVVDIENADGTVEEQHIVVKKTETMGSVKRRMSVSMGLSSEQVLHKHFS
eukprot:COSAG02_NODE_54450_length_296_cov_0.639594_1_plen_69_part_01